MKQFFKSAFDEIMAQTNLPRSITGPLFRDMEAAYPGSIKDMEKAAGRWIGEADWTWHWFDECLEIFQGSKKWPSNAAWSWFQGAQPRPPRSIATALELFSVSELREIGKRHGVPLTGCKSRGDIESGMEANLKWTLFKEEADAKFDAAVLSKHLQRQRDAKLHLLALSIHYSAFNRFRRDQIDDLLKDAIFKYAVVIKADDCKAAREAAAQFKSGQRSDLPPYFPGDRSVIDTKRQGRQEKVK